MLSAAALALALALAAGPPLRPATPGQAPALALPREPAGRIVHVEEVERPRAWSGDDVMLEALFGLSMLVDWNQTRYTIGANRDVPGQSGQRYYETNPLLGRSPSTARVDLYFAGTAVVHLAVAHLLPHGGWRTAWQLAGLGLEVGVIGRNAAMGVRLRF